MLRQAPNVILVGEMRDHETVQIGLRAALTGHLVLSTLHTNDAISSALRLSDMGVESFMVAAALRGVVAQRLVKRICPNCKVPHQLSKQENIWLQYRWLMRRLRGASISRAEFAFILATGAGVQQQYVTASVAAIRQEQQQQ